MDKIDFEKSTQTQKVVALWGIISNSVSVIVRGLIKVYQYVISPWVKPCCRFYPSCSVYSRQALEIHGALKGGWLMIKRLGRCHPLCEGGYDPVPDR